jgi:hypothetical protein
MHLGDYTISISPFKNQETVFKEFQKEPFKSLGDQQKSERVNHALLQLIQNAEMPAFLLPSILFFIDQINREKILENYTFSNFELWLNQSSGLSGEENYQVRGRIVGKIVPRDEYQVFFPVGMGKLYPGSHYVTAHTSPDLDTTIASFWGWIDAFGARVSEGLHLWNVPGGPPISQVEIDLLFNKIFGERVFSYVTKTRPSLGLSSVDLLSQKGLVRKHPQDSTLSIDHQGTHNAVVVVDKNGYYLGDWRNFDVEGVRQVIILLNHCLRWFENNMHMKLISLFAKETLLQEEFPQLLQEIFGTRIREVQPVREFSEKQKSQLHDYLEKVFGVADGLESTFESFAHAMKKLGLSEFQEFVDLIESFPQSALFNSSGMLTEDRPRIFHFLEKVILSLDRAILSVRTYEERLEVALNIKTEVLGYLPQVVSHRAEVEEVRSKMGDYPYLTVTTSDRTGRQVPVGVIHASDLHKNVLGTVSLRDFCNREETKIPSYLEVISVIDHHKSSLSTLSAPVAMISDAQSSNALVAELTFLINDSYSTGGMTLAEIDQQLEIATKTLATPSQKRILQRLLSRHMAASADPLFCISPEREFVEYLHFLYAILDDTDLLTKVTRRDLECVASLLNRLKSLSVRKEVEAVHFDDLPPNKEFLQKAAKRILQNEEMYSLYQKIYIAKEKAVEVNFQLCADGKESTIFLDTKEQNGCCRIGQTKMFARNFPIFEKLVRKLQKAWFEESKVVFKERPEVDLYIHMISTIAGAEDLFSGKEDPHKHQDELWIWIPSTESGIEHLKNFLNAFRNSPGIAGSPLEAEFLGNNAKELMQIFKESFLPISLKETSTTENLPIAILRYKAGVLNSRKAMISPFLPHLVM